MAQIGTNTVVGTYDAATGAVINPALITGQIANAPWGITLDDNNHLFWSNPLGNSISEFNAITRATVDAAFVNGQGLNQPKSVLFMSVPEPSSLALAALSLLGVVVFARRRRAAIGASRLSLALP